MEEDVLYSLSFLDQDPVPSPRVNCPRVWPEPRSGRTVAQLASRPPWGEIHRASCYRQRYSTRIALKYGVTMEQIKRANKLFSNDCIFLRNSLNIPVVSQKRSIFNGLSLESPDGDSDVPCQDADARYVVTQDIEGPSPPPSPPPTDSKASQPQPEELSAKDFLHRLDLQIKQSKQAARRLKEEELRNNEDYKAPATSYQEI